MGNPYILFGLVLVKQNEGFDEFLVSPSSGDVVRKFRQKSKPKRQSPGWTMYLPTRVISDMSNKGIPPAS